MFNAMSTNFSANCDRSYSKVDFSLNGRHSVKFYEKEAIVNLDPRVGVCAV